MRAGPGAKLSTALSFGSALLSAFLGKSKGSGNVGRATSAARGVGRSVKESSDVGRAEEDLRTASEQARELEEQLAADVARVSAEHDPTGEGLAPRVLRPKKSGIGVRAVVLAWAPYDAASGAPLWAADV